MTPETLNRYNSTSPKVTNFFYIYLCLKNHLVNIPIYVVWSKNCILNDIKSISVGNHLFLEPFLCILGGLGAHLSLLL